MNKFAIITAVFVISVITVMGDFVVRDYVARQGQTSVLTANDGKIVTDPVTTAPTPVTTVQTPQTTSNTPTQAFPVSQTPIFPVDPTDTQIAAVPRSKITDVIIKNAGFVGILTEKHFDGKVFQLLDVTKTPVSAINFTEVSENSAPVTSITEIILPDEIRALQMYVLLQNKTKTYIDLSLNETNAYGDRSFYVNHAKKPDEAFLIVKIEKTIYCFAYVKSYHPQIKKLISLLVG